MSTALDLVKSYMSLWGWSDAGNPGSVKRDADNKIIARHGDAVWIADVQLACASLIRLADRSKAPPS
jgi:hypothetical protein